MVPLLARLVPNPLAPRAIPLDSMEGLPGTEHDTAAPLTSVMLVSPFQLGHTPLISMGLGVIALVISIILFTATTTSLAEEVWISCVVILFTVMILSLIPISFSVVKRRLKSMTGTSDV